MSGQPYHSACLRCGDCAVQLETNCYVRGERIFCHRHFITRFGIKCAGCTNGIFPSERVRRAHAHVYHIRCFTCGVCRRLFETGDEFYLLEDSTLICKADFESLESRGSDSDSSKRPRTTILSGQLDALKTAYNKSSKPSRGVREKLSAETGLDMRVVQVWFQNRRAKEKRLRKDAGRQRPAWERSHSYSNFEDGVNKTLVWERKQPCCDAEKLNKQMTSTPHSSRRVFNSCAEAWSTKWDMVNSGLNCSKLF